MYAIEMCLQQEMRFTSNQGLFQFITMSANENKHTQFQHVQSTCTLNIDSLETNL